MKKIIFVFLISIISTRALADSAGWLSIKTTSDGITAQKKEIPGSPVLAFRGEGIIDAPITKVATIIFDTKRATEWVDDLALAKVVRWISDDEWVEYDHVNTPPIIMKDRDFVSRVKLTIDSKNKSIQFLYHNTVDPDAPETNYVRGDLINTTFILTSLDNNLRTHVVGEIHCDPKGSVAKWIVNFFQSEWPINTIRKLRKEAARPDIKENEKIASLFNVVSAKPTPTPTPAHHKK